jgi:aspartate-semialdehyde dehydrogenase
MSIAVGILGATGTVGQRFIELLDNHPLFYVKAIGASERSSGKTYKEACTWKMTVPIPAKVASMTVTSCQSVHFEGCQIIFSGLDASVAGDIELEFLNAEFAVFSNAKNHRMKSNVPLIVPTVNADHFDIIPEQRKAFGLKKGFLITNANCSTTGLVAALKPLQDKFGTISRIIVSTMQAISGAGYPGVPSLDILGNVVPYISGEEPKMEAETCKILGQVHSSKQSILDLSSTKVSASCNRVAVIEGHTEAVFIEFAQKPAPSVEQVISAFEEYTCDAQRLECFSAPSRAIVVCEDRDRPQPRLDALLEKGNAVIVGGIRKCNVFDIKLNLLVHNTILGAAGSSIMNAELAVAKGLIEK